MSEEVSDRAPEASAPTGAPARSSRRMLAAVFVGVVVTGLCCGLGTAPFLGFDEYRHFAHAWQVSDGRVFPLDGHTDSGRSSQGGFVPSGVVHDMNTLVADGQSHRARRLFTRLGDRASGGRPEYVDFSNVASYSIVAYLPAAIAIRIGRLLGASTLMLLLLARAFGLLAYAALATLAVRRVPTRRWLMAVLCLTPVAVVQASTVSADGVTIGLSLVVVAEALRLAVQPRGAVTRAGCIGAGIALFALALAKPPYVLLGLLYIVAIVRHRAIAAKVLVPAGAAAAASAAGWNVWASRHYAQQYYVLAQLNEHFYAFRGVDSTRQLTHVATAPWSFAAAIGRTLLLYWSPIGHDVVMQSPAWPSAEWMAVFEFAVLLGTVAVVVDRIDISVVRPVAAVTAGLTAIAVFLLAYAGWNRLRAPRIDAVDGRYFFPVLALGLLAVTPVLGRRWPAATRRTATRALFATQLALTLAVGGMSVHDSYVRSVTKPLEVGAPSRVLREIRAS